MWIGFTTNSRHSWFIKSLCILQDSGLVSWAWRSPIYMDWYNAPIKVGTSSDTVIAKAREISNTLNIAEEDFKAPWGWLANFRSRKGLGLILLFTWWRSQNWQRKSRVIELFEHVSWKLLQESGNINWISWGNASRPRYCWGWTDIPSCRWNGGVYCRWH